MADKTQKVAVRTSPAREPLPEETFSPLVDVYETQDGTTVLVAEVPGARADKIDVRVDKGVLTIYADGRSEESYPEYTRTYTGFVSGQFFRAFALSDEIDRENIAASLADGVLTLSLPRAEAAKTRKIEIQSG